MQLRDDQLRVLRHMLGIDHPTVKEPKSYRNYYCACPDDPLMNGLRHLGFVRMYRKDDKYEWFTATDTGIAAAFASHKKIRLPKSKRMYHKFLDLRDCWPDLTFWEFLTDPELAETRRSV